MSERTRITDRKRSGRVGRTVRRASTPYPLDHRRANAQYLQQITSVNPAFACVGDKAVPMWSARRTGADDAASIPPVPC
ncbi:hypothetical protein BST23_05305 [Mycolicibacterium elephantis]|uniref:Uncharacterized protein n=1 Tax=Mycolicibacterium elephantis TaxID=81858 RepID=A0A0M2ZNH9_9MYCO|nr:hypothetical protein AAV95_05245 [Mycolicibacterium elephantis]OBB17554.1 hypothetical protein A5762_23680 [Mycolicibacterium elephantis]ORA67806.1 hypothetical protein BST23_05305 [Mycolicibacterium elephantis]